MLKALKAHALAVVLLLALFTLAYGAVAFRNGDFQLFLGMWLYLLLPGGFLVIGVSSLIALPVGIFLNRALTYNGYTSLPEFLWAGSIAGIALAMLTQGLFVTTAPESNGYQEIWGTARAMLFVWHYGLGVIAGAIHALTYWYTFREPLHHA